MIVITGATGNTGKPLAMELLKSGEKVRVVSRNPEKAKELTDMGAELVQADMSDSAALERALHGAKSVYAMIPYNPSVEDLFAHQRNISDSIAGAIKNAGVTHVVTLSSVGAQLESGTGVIMGLHYMEKKINNINNINVLHLRCTYFMENLFGNIDMIKKAGFMGSPIRGDINMPMIATRDIAAYACKRMKALDFTGKNHQYLLGQRDLTMNNVAEILGREIGLPNLKYDTVGADMFIDAVKSAGMSASVANLMVEFMGAVNSGQVMSGIKRDNESTTPTSIEEFARIFAMVYNK